MACKVKQVIKVCCRINNKAIPSDGDKFSLSPSQRLSNRRHSCTSVLLGLALSFLSIQDICAGHSVRQEMTQLYEISTIAYRMLSIALTLLPSAFAGLMTHMA